MPDFTRITEDQERMSKYDKIERFMRVMMAMQSFAGKSMKALDAAEFLTADDVYHMEAGLLAMVPWLRQQSAFPDLAVLATEIETRLRSGRRS